MGDHFSWYVSLFLFCFVCLRLCLGRNAWILSPQGSGCIHAEFPTFSLFPSKCRVKPSPTFTWQDHLAEVTSIWGPCFDSFLGSPGRESMRWLFSLTQLPKWYGLAVLSGCTPLTCPLQTHTHTLITLTHKFVFSLEYLNIPLILVFILLFQKRERRFRDCLGRQNTEWQY